MHYACVCACWRTRAVCVHSVSAQHICVQCGSVCVHYACVCACWRTHAICVHTCAAWECVCTMHVCAPVGRCVLFVCTV